MVVVDLFNYRSKVRFIMSWLKILYMGWMAAPIDIRG